MEIIKHESAKKEYGCDVVVKFPVGGSDGNGKIRLLQVTDMQIIDAEQRRVPDRLCADEIIAWSQDKIDANFGNHMKSLVPFSPFPGGSKIFDGFFVERE